MSFKLGKSDKKEKKQNATMPANARLPSYTEDGTNGGFTGSPTHTAIGQMQDGEVLEKFEKMLVSGDWWLKISKYF